MNKTNGINNEVVRQISAYLERTDKRQYELASEIGVPPPTINRWLNGKAKVSKAYQVILRAKGVIP
ncbi:MAG: helix-turn-helix transcriptional regulator [Candidatus Omnitrophica bacterium]|nr:helix-turn-helix transcriptional regulator [Candidatus Omnitrophota bacterium]